MKKILITRPLKSSQKIARLFDKKDITYLVQPLFSVSKTNPKSINQKIQAVLITSSEAVYALRKLAIKDDVLILTVGKKTADNVKKLKYSNVLEASNSAASLLEMVQKKLKKNGGLIVYISGEKITLDLAGKLNNQGFEAKRIIAYKTIENTEFQDQTITEIKNHNISEVLIYSQNSLEIFYNLAQKHNLLKYLNQIQISCLSSKIADLAKQKGFLKIGIIKEYE